MAPLTDSVHNRYNAVKDDDEEEEYYEEEWNLSARTKNILIAVGVVVCVAMVYLFCVVLPAMFIPELRVLVGINKVEKLGVSLKPVPAAKAASWMFHEMQVEGSEDSEDEVEVEEVQQKTGEDVQTGAVHKERLILVGDVHGMYIELRKLLRKIKYDMDKDHLLVVGDFVAKGPDLMKVLDFLIDHNADCILGNHEYYALQNYAKFHGLASPYFVDGSSAAPEPQVGSAGFIEDPEFLLAKKLQPRHVEYINKCPLIKQLGAVPVHLKAAAGGRKSAQGLAVHAGLRWDLTDLNEQNPTDCLEMRSYLSPFYNETTDDPHADGAVSWSKVWNAKQKEATHKSVVYYGHDARRGLNLKKYAKGLDTGCARGDYMSAMVIWQEIEPTKRGLRVLYKEHAVQVRC